MAEENLNLMASCIYANKFTRSGASTAQKIVVAESRQRLLETGKADEAGAVPTCAEISGRLGSSDTGIFPDVWPLLLLGHHIYGAQD